MKSMTLVEYVKEIEENQVYEQYIRAIDLYLLDESLNEDLMGFFKDQLDLIKEIANTIKIDVKNLLVLFKEKIIFTLFQKLKWSVKALVDLVHNGFKIHKKLHNIIFNWAKQNKIVKMTDEALIKLDKYLSEHKELKHVTGLLVAGFLAYQWVNLIAFTGEIDFDFDQTSLFQALSGRFDLIDLFGGENGLKLLTFISVNVLTGLTFPYPGNSWILFAISIIYTIAKHKKPEIAKAMVPVIKRLSKDKK